MTAAFPPVVFDAPLVNPAPNGLFGAVTWAEESGPLRWLGAGVDIRVFNYGGGPSYGVWQADPFALDGDLEAGDVKTPGERPADPDTFPHFTSWAADYCAVTAPAQAETLLRAQQIHKLQEQTAVESFLTDRLLTDGGAPFAADDIVHAVSEIEGLFAATSTVGVIHASAKLAAYAVKNDMAKQNGTRWLSPLGHQWVFGGGYMEGLGDTLVATSPLFGWRGPVVPREVIKHEWNRHYVIVERSLVIGYEAALGAVSLGQS